MLQRESAVPPKSSLLYYARAMAKKNIFCGSICKQSLSKNRFRVCLSEQEINKELPDS